VPSFLVAPRDQRVSTDLGFVSMPHTKSAKKRLRQSEERRQRNRITKKVIKTYSKRALAAAQEGRSEAAEADMRFALSKLDKAGARRVYHPNTAARRKSLLMREVKRALASAQKSDNSSNA
jgi:small subunit ribosomal protein S20